MGFISDRFDLEKQVVFYLSYHLDKTNQFIHFACIWPILITAFIMVADTPALMAQPAFLEQVPLGQYMVLNATAIAALVYMSWYILLDPRAGSLGALLVFAVYIFANYFSQIAPDTFGVSGWEIALPIHVVAWILQFIGHGVYERRKPALLDSLDQALITAPMFVLLELLFSFGYRQDMYLRVSAQAEANAKAFRAGANKKAAFDESTPLVTQAK